MKKSGALPVEMGGNTLWEVVTNSFGLYSIGSELPKHFWCEWGMWK